MKKYISNLFLSIDAFFIRKLPAQWYPCWLRLIRGEYSASNAQMYLRAALWLKINYVDGDIYEFGVGSGSSSAMIFNFIQRFERINLRRFFLFDSFEGLPESSGVDSHPQWKKGSWAFGMEEIRRRFRSQGIQLSKIFMIPGYFSESLTDPDLKSNFKFNKAALVHIDCDLYTSTFDALNFMTPFIQSGTLILLDDYFCYGGNPLKGEAAAFNEWVNNNNFIVTHWQTYSLHGNSFIISLKN